MPDHDKYMYRCLQLAKMAAGNTLSNPMVGAVLVHDSRIIGEGYHQEYGRAHAEVNCINSVDPADKRLIPVSTLYVSLEPCAHHGKTPPCADRIIAEQIKKVVIGCPDPFKEVDGKGTEKLKAAGIKVTADILKDECEALNKRFFTFHIKHRPYIIAKWAQTADGFIAPAEKSRLKISNAFTDRLVHKWRSEEAAIMIGTDTALLDDPSLTTRLWKGNNPLRIVIDMNLRLPISLRIFSDGNKTIVFNKTKTETVDNIIYIKIDPEYFTEDICDALYKLNIQSVLIEGGVKLLQTFINNGFWDEARIISGNTIVAPEGLKAPELLNAKIDSTMVLLSDTISIYKKIKPQ